MKTYGTAGRIGRILIGALLLAAAAFAALFVKDYIDQRNPYYAIPQLTLTADGREAVITAVDGRAVSNIQAVGYSWRFLFGAEAELPRPLIEEAFDRGIPTVEMQGGEQISFVFSRQPAGFLVDRSVEPYTYDFYKPAEDDRMVPYEPGIYVYMVDATFEEGMVHYYFCLVVLE